MRDLCVLVIFQLQPGCSWLLILFLFTISTICPRGFVYIFADLKRLIQVSTWKNRDWTWYERKCDPTSLGEWNEEYARTFLIAHHFTPQLLRRSQGTTFCKQTPAIERWMNKFRLVLGQKGMRVKLGCRAKNEHAQASSPLWRKFGNTSIHFLAPHPSHCSKKSSL